MNSASSSPSAAAWRIALVSRPGVFDRLVAGARVPDARPCRSSPASPRAAGTPGASLRSLRPARSSCDERVVVAARWTTGSSRRPHRPRRARPSDRVRPSLSGPVRITLLGEDIERHGPRRHHDELRVALEHCLCRCRYRTGSVSFGSGPTQTIVSAAFRSSIVAVDPATGPMSRASSYGAPASWMRESMSAVPRTPRASFEIA